MPSTLARGLLVLFLLVGGGCSRGAGTAPGASVAPPPNAAYARPVPPAPATPRAMEASPRPSPSAPVPSGGGEGFARLNVPFETMVAEARGRGKPAILYVCATWCGACSRMNREVLSDARVQERLRAFPTAKYDPNTPAGRALADRYDIWAYPEMVLVDGSGRELERIKGAGDPARMLRILGRY